MKNAKKLIYLLVQLLSLVTLLVFITKGGIGILLGGEVVQIIKMIVEFGVITFAMCGIVTGQLNKTDRHTAFRDTQTQIFKYIGVLGFLQLIAMFVTGTFGALGTGVIDKIPQMIPQIITVTFGLVALMMPFNTLKQAFTRIKSYEFRDPRRIVRDFYE